MLAASRGSLGSGVDVGWTGELRVTHLKTRNYDVSSSCEQGRYVVCGGVWRCDLGLEEGLSLGGGPGLWLYRPT